MSKIVLFLGLLIISSCEMAQIRYGYYWNPITILSIAEEGLKSNNLAKFSDVLSDSALCNYGTQEGMLNLKQVLREVEVSSLREPSKISSNHLPQPRWNGYFVYYEERYVATGKDLDGRTILKINILCQFGDGQKSNRFINAPASSYGTVSCSIEKIKNFENDLNDPVCN